MIDRYRYHTANDRDGIWVVPINQSSATWCTWIRPHYCLGTKLRSAVHITHHRWPSAPGYYLGRYTIPRLFRVILQKVPFFVSSFLVPIFVCTDEIIRAELKKIKNHETEIGQAGRIDGKTTEKRRIYMTKIQVMKVITRDLIMHRMSYLKNHNEFNDAYNNVYFQFLNLSNKLKLLEFGYTPKFFTSTTSKQSE